MFDKAVSVVIVVRIVGNAHEDEGDRHHADDNRDGHPDCGTAGHFGDLFLNSVSEGIVYVEGRGQMTVADISKVSDEKTCVLLLLVCLEV